MSSEPMPELVESPCLEDDFQLDEAEVFDTNPGEPTADLVVTDDPIGQEADLTRACDCCGTHPGDPDPGSDEGASISVLNGRDIWCRLAHAGLYGNQRWKVAPNYSEVTVVSSWSWARRVLALTDSSSYAPLSFRCCSETITRND
jgi:hypothetical protein